MCATCGCSDDSQARLTDLQSGKTILLDTPPDLGHAHAGHADHEHDHDHHHHHHDHDHAHGPGHGHDGHHHDHAGGHAPSHSHGTIIRLEQEVLARNDRLAERVRGWLAGRGIL